MKFVLKNEKIKQSSIEWIQRLRLNGIPYVVSVEQKKETRRLAQNNLLWVWLDFIAKYFQENTEQCLSADDWYLYFVNKFLPKKVKEINGECIVQQITSSNLSIKEFSDFLMKIEGYCLHQWALGIPIPNEYYNKAMGIK